VRRSIDGVWFVNIFTHRLQVVTTINYLTLSGFHTRDHTTLYLLRVLSVVFAIRFLATDLSQELSLQITMNSSCHFLFNHLWPPTLQNSTQFSNSNSLVPLATKILWLCRLGSDLTENTCHVSECVFIGPLPSTGYGADHMRNTSTVVRIVVLPSTELYHGPQRTQLLLLCVRWNVYIESFPSNGYMRDDINLYDTQLPWSMKSAVLQTAAGSC
jgi:hypothetical protein